MRNYMISVHFPNPGRQFVRLGHALHEMGACPIPKLPNTWTLRTASTAAEVFDNLKPYLDATHDCLAVVQVEGPCLLAEAA